MYKIMTLILIFLFQIQHNYSQEQKKIDSLTLAFKKQQTDIEKIKIANLIFKELKHKNPETAYEYAKKSLKLAIKNNSIKEKGISYRNLGYYFRFKPDIDSSRYYFKESYKLLDDDKHILEFVGTAEEYATFECMQGNYDEAINIANKGLKKAEEVKSSHHMLICLNRMTTIYTDSGNFEKATKLNLKAFKVLDTTLNKNKIFKATALGHKARIEMLRGNFHLTLKPLKDGLIIYKELNEFHWLAVNYIEIGNAYWYLEDYDNALNAYEESLVISKKIKRNDFIWLALSNIASLYTEKGQYKQAIEILKKSIEVSKDIGSKINIITGLNLIAVAYYNSGQYKEAIYNHTESIKLATSLNALEVARDGYMGRSEVYEKIGKYVAALNDIKTYIKLNDSIFSLESNKQIEELKTIYETEKKEAEISLQQQEIKNLNQEVEISNLKKGLYAGGMFTFLTVSGLLLFGFKQRLKKNKIEREKQEEIYKQEIEFKKKELASQTLHLVQKNTFIQELKENLEKIKQSPELFKIEFRRLVMLLKKESAEDKDWEVFKSYFSEVHNNFDIKLKEIYANITEKEIRLASFLRMNLSTKEIASLLNVLPESILKSKYRLKKKLNLNPETDLTEFLNTI